MGNKLTRKCTIGLTDYKVHFPLTLPAVIDNPIELRQLNLEASLLGTLTDIIVVHGDEQNHSSNVKADMTDWFMHQKYKEFRELSIHAEAVARQMTKDPVSMFTFDCWGAVYRKGEYTKKHNHWGNLWSWCYYLEVPPDAPPFRFEDITAMGESEPSSFDVYPKENDLLVFPSWVSHSVPKSESNSERIMVAGNIQIDHSSSSQPNLNEMMQTMVEKYI